MHPRRRVILLALALVALLALIAAPAAFASAGGGSAGFAPSGGGGGGGGGGAGRAFEIYILVRILVIIVVDTHGIGLIVLLALAAAWWLTTRGGPRMEQWWGARRRQGRSYRRATKVRERKVSLAAAEAEDENPIFGPAAVREAAASLFTDIQLAWSADDRIKLRGLLTPELANEWERRLDDFERKGWTNKVEPIGPPKVEYVGLARKNRHDTTSGDRVVIRIEAKLRDFVVDRSGRHIKREGSFTESVRMREYWTLERRGEHWVLASIESGAEGEHALQDKIVQTEWADDQAMRDEAMVEGAVAEQAPAGTSVAELADLQFTGDAQAAAMDLSLADGRFAPDILEVAARRAVAAWTLAVDGPDDELKRIATPDAVQDLLHPGDPSAQTRLVVRGAQVQRIRVIGLDAAATPPTMTIDVDLRGRRYIEERDTTRVLMGSATRLVGFTERWTLATTDDAAEPWRIVSVQTPLPTA
ncbi:MAG TPA: TIM44-like domain-containing protein [Solirubrobacteraceae bacterium]|nr:TIM44-like domain-containing protein [Solirubrobacteraceae bacterium]